MRNVVIVPAMGESRRFAAEGYAGPKCLLTLRSPWGEQKTMIEWIVGAIPPGWCALLVAPRERYEEFNRLTAKCMIMYLTEPTRGQTETIARGLSMCEGPVAVHNCDLVYPSLAEMLTPHHREDLGAGRVALHYSESEAYSFVDDAMLARFFAEKRRISPYAQTGVWSFRDARTIQEACEKQLGGEPPNYGGEYYFSGALNHVHVGMRGILDRNWTDWGTPEAVRRSGWEIVT